MRIAFFSTSTRFSGGRVAMFGHAEELSRRGHEIELFIEEASPHVGWMKLTMPLHTFSSRSLDSLPQFDLYIFDRIRLAQPLYQARKGQVVHLCQGYEGIDTELRLAQLKSQGFGISRWLKKRRLRRRLGNIEAAYQLDTIKLTTHTPLVEVLQQRFGQKAWLVPYGLDSNIFVPSNRPTTGKTILVVGPSDIGWKRIGDALHVVQQLKQNDPEIRLVRIAQHPMRDEERRLGVTDEYHEMLSPHEMAQFYQRADVLLLTSDSSEGFGLPALEAMACGLPCVLTAIPAFLSFDTPTDFSRFAPVGGIAEMATAIQELLGSSRDRQRFRQRGLQVAERFTRQRSFDTFEKTIEAMVEQTAQAASLRSVA